MSTKRILNIIDDLENKLKNQNRPLNMNINNINNNFQNFNQNRNFQSMDEFIHPNINFDLNKPDFSNEKNIRNIIKEEFAILIYPYSELFNRINYLESKINSINNKINANQEQINKNMNNINIDNRINIDYGNKILELEYKISEFESFF